MNQYFHTIRRTAPRAEPWENRPTPRGSAASGRIARLFVGQGHGFIRATVGADIFFHRGDVHQGTSFSNFAVGDLVTFELLDDRISGPRALDVRQRLSRR